LYFLTHFLIPVFISLSFSFLRKEGGGKKERKKNKKEEREEGREKERLVIQPTIGGITSHQEDFRVLIEVSFNHTALLGAIQLQEIEPKTV
jgi:hypothetical protein